MSNPWNPASWLELKLNDVTESIKQKNIMHRDFNKLNSCNPNPGCKFSHGENCGLVKTLECAYCLSGHFHQT